MATREGAGMGLEGVDQFEAISQEIEERFSHFHSLLETQKAVLLERVKRMRELFQKHRDMDKAIGELERIRKATNEMLSENMNVGNKDEVTKLWDGKISDLKKRKCELDRVSELKFVENAEEFSHCVKHIHVRETEAVSYRERREPLVMKGKRGIGDGEFIRPIGLSVDKATNQIFVNENMKGFVSIYSAEGKFIKSFGGEQLKNPCGICVSGVFVFVTDVGNKSVFKFDKTGEFVKQTISEGRGAVKFNIPFGLCELNKHVYVCDGGSNSIKVLNGDLEFVKSFGKEFLESPRDIKYKDDKLFVLTQSENTIHTFNTQHIYLRPILFTGQKNEISVSFFFTIDLEGNFIICDTIGNCLKVFNHSGEYVQSLGDGFLLAPTGIDTDNSQHIVTCSDSNYNSIQLY